MSKFNKPFPVFADFLCINDLEDVDCNKAAIECKDFCKILESVKKSNLGGHQSGFIDFDIMREKYSELVKIHDYALDIANEVIPHKDIIIGSSWININSRGDSNSVHAHPNSVLSAVFYVKAPEDSGEIVFQRDRPFYDYAGDVYYSQFEPAISLLDYRIQPNAGKFVMFPAYLLHRVMASKSDEERISIAMNFSSLD
jgi:uncharacterized protein (TIGR02466 family)